MTENTPEATEPETTEPEQPQTDEQPSVPTDSITGWAVYDTTLGQFVGGVTRGKKPTAKDAKATMEAYGLGGNKHELRQV